MRNPWHFVVGLCVLVGPLARAVPTDAEAVFSFAPASAGGPGAGSAGQFVLSAAEHSRFLNGLLEPRFAEFTIFNAGPSPARVEEVFIYDPNHIIVYGARFGTAGAFSDFLPATIPPSILSLFTPTDTFVAVPAAITGIVPGTYWGLDQDLGSGIVEALDAGTVKIGLLVTDGNGDTHAYIDVPDASPTLLLVVIASGLAWILPGRAARPGGTR